MRRIIFLLFVVLCFQIASCQSSDQEADQEQTPPAGEDESEGILLIKSGFEEGVNVTADMSRLTGSDFPGYGWEDNPAWISSSKFVYLVNNEATRLPEFMETKIENQVGHDGNTSRVLRLINKADDPNQQATSRNEYSIFGKTPPNDFKEGYVRYWMKLQDNLPSLVPFKDDAPWYMIMEWKEPDSGNAKTAEECAACCNADEGGSNNYRINIGIYKYANTDRFLWRIMGEHPQPCRVTEWEYRTGSVPVPFGEWFLVEAYMKKDATDGRVYFAVNGKVVLDTDKTKPNGFTGRTQHADNPLPLHFWSPMKNYHSMVWNESGPVSQWYDDFELWSGFPPGHPELKN